MKNLILPVFLFLFSTVCSAQFSYKLMAGANINSYWNKKDLHRIANIGIRAGLNAEYAFHKHLSFVPALYLSQKGGTLLDLSSTSGGGSVSTDHVVREYYLEIPLNIQVRAHLTGKTNFIFAMGPYIACGIGGKTKVKRLFSSGIPFKESSYDEKISTFGKDGMNIDRLDCGWNGVIGFEFSKFILAMNGQFGFTEVYDPGSIRNISGGILVGYAF